ncbi:MAG TPA: hypothetical protein VG860_01640 [Terriglobia bacterium]|nr:hypothetical protein [Terriglobia bacterium]
MSGTPTRGSVRGRKMLEDSLRKLGAGRSVLVDRQGRVIAGNKTVETARKLGLKEIAVIETDGETLVAVRRGDLDLTTDKRAVELAVADNRVAEIDLDWNAEVLAALDIDLGQFWDEEELAELMSDDGGPASPEEARRTLVERFGVPPFSVLDARQGYWQDRKRAWIALGIKSELGRGGEGNLLGLEPAEQARARWKASPGGSPRPAADYSKHQRGDGSGKAIE